MRSWARVAAAAGLAIGLVLPSPAAAQCVGDQPSEQFAVNMVGCAGVVAFAARASLCAPGWHVCSAEEWVIRSAAKVPTYNYWTDDDLSYDSDGGGCYAGVGVSEPCTGPMHVCTVGRADFDGAYVGGAKVYILQTFLPEGSPTVATSIDSATLATQTFIGAFAVQDFTPVFTGARLGAPGALSLAFTSETSAFDGVATVSRLQTQQFWPSVDFQSVADPLGNTCHPHSCGFNTGTPNRSFGGCNAPTAGTLCCQ